MKKNPENVSEWDSTRVHEISQKLLVMHLFIGPFLLCVYENSYLHTLINDQSSDNYNSYTIIEGNNVRNDYRHCLFKLMKPVGIEEILQMREH